MKSFWILLVLCAMTYAPVAGHPSPDAVLVDSTQIYYATQNVSALQRMLAQTNDRALALLCRYRLYPLTQDPSYLEDLPTELEAPTARELALLSGLWGYRVRESSVLKVPVYGKRATRLLDQAKALDPTEPFVLLIDGQSLLYRPKIFGGNKQKALDQFNTLRETLPATSGTGISKMEADLWLWYTLAQLDTDEAETFRSELLAQNPPPLYKTFLLDPP